MTSQRTARRLAFVDHSFHLKTRSGDFLRAILSEHWEIVDFWDERWNRGPGVPTSALNEFDVVFFFQVLGDLNELARLNASIIWVPMFDGQRLDFEYWARLSALNLKIIAFSNVIARQSRLFGVPCLQLRYFPDPSSLPAMEKKSGRRFFLWYRGSVTFSDIERIIDPSDVDDFCVLSLPDPGFEHIEINNELIEKYNVRILYRDFLERAEYLTLLSQSNIFLAPRKKEGIGMSVLEALAVGQCVVAYNRPTMNEYIVHGVNGYLYGSDLQRLSFSSEEEVAKVSARSIRQAMLGYCAWKSSKNRVVPFIINTKKNLVQILIASILSLVICGYDYLRLMKRI